MLLPVKFANRHTASYRITRHTTTSNYRFYGNPSGINDSKGFVVVGYCGINDYRNAQQIIKSSRCTNTRMLRMGIQGLVKDMYVRLIVNV